MKNFHRFSRPNAGNANPEQLQHKASLAGGVVTLLSCALLLAATHSTEALAGKPTPGTPGFKLDIREVYLTDPFALDADPNNQLIDIYGKDLNPGDSFLVTTLGSWTLVCDAPDTNFTHLLCELPAGGVGIAGDYELIVGSGVGQTAGDLYALTISEPPVPDGTIAFFASSACPPGWGEYTQARGFAIVGLQASGTVEGSVGSPLSNVEDRNGHVHQVTTETAGAHTHDVDIAQFVSGANVGSRLEPVTLIEDHVVASDPHDHAINPPSTTSTSAGSHSHDGETAVPDEEDVLPYIQLLACAKQCISNCN